MRVAIVLYKLGSCAEYRVISNQFGVHKSTVKKFVYLFCKGMVQGPTKQLIRVPNEEEATEIARRFQEAHNIPQIMGLIDGTHIPILPPSDGYKDLVNRKGWPSYVLQAVVDHKSCFWSISCKMPGSAHDANVLRQSDLFQRCHLLPKGVKNIEGQDTRLLIVGDPAYPLLDWLLKGYTNSARLIPEQEYFYVYLSSLQVGVENTFGMLKSRWRVLLKRSDFHFSFTPAVIATCCALHNFRMRRTIPTAGGWKRLVTSIPCILSLTSQ
ncbi:putative nuclease HARBI1-like [Triplophysa rosa]|uniref:Nuclease HARBI1-like n=1 Tax=Triplophysa rosa TaxID=992332 RepID=A0A9W7WCC2_TRIRA|nr:putative nuclease HARBI1-like [Triplophysa rosa]